jgi:hypothetical protein
MDLFATEFDGMFRFAVLWRLFVMTIPNLLL